MSSSYEEKGFAISAPKVRGRGQREGSTTMDELGYYIPCKPLVVSKLNGLFLIYPDSRCRYLTFWESIQWRLGWISIEKLISRPVNYGL